MAAQFCGVNHVRTNLIACAGIHVLGFMELYGCDYRAQALVLVWARCIESADAALASCEANAVLIVLFAAILEHFIS